MKNALSILLFVFASNAVASTITFDFDASHSGSYRDNGVKKNGAIFAGFNDAPAPTDYNSRNWLAFDMDSIINELSLSSFNINDLLTASLFIANDSQNIDVNLNFTWSSLDVSINELTSSDATEDQDAFTNSTIYFEDFINGSLFSEGTASAGSTDHYAFNSTAITSLMTTTGFWTIGGMTESDLGSAYGYTSGVDSGDDIRLSLVFNEQIAVVPVPAAAWLFGSGLLTILGIARRKVT